MKRLFFACTILLLSWGCAKKVPPAVVTIQPDKNVSETQIALIEKHLAGFPNETQAAIAYIQADSACYVGVRRTNDSLVRVENRDSVFEIGSITKVFTSTLLVHAIGEKKAQLSDRPSSFYTFAFKEEEKGGKAISLQSLSNHTSGLPRLPTNMEEIMKKNPDNPYKGYDQGMLESYLRNELSLESVPGTRYLYSNLGAGLLGNVLEHALSMSYERALQQKIFEPLGMEHSTTYREDVQSRLVAGRNPAGAITPNWDLNSLKAAGAILSCAQDLVKFAFANFSADSLLAMQREKTFTIDEKMDMALGWHILHQQQGEYWHWHNGGTGGYRSSMALDVAGKKAVIILSNVSAFHPQSDHIDQLCFELMRSLE